MAKAQMNHMEARGKKSYDKQDLIYSQILY